MNTQRNRINRQDRQKITFHGSTYPKEISQSALPLHTQKQCTARDPFGGLPSLSLTTKGSWMHIWDGRQASHQPSDASTRALDATTKTFGRYFAREVGKTAAG